MVRIACRVIIVEKGKGGEGGTWRRWRERKSEQYLGEKD